MIMKCQSVISIRRVQKIRQNSSLKFEMKKSMLAKNENFRKIVHFCEKYVENFRQSYCYTSVQFIIGSKRMCECART